MPPSLRCAWSWMLLAPPMAREQRVWPSSGACGRVFRWRFVFELFLFDMIGVTVACRVSVGDPTGLWTGPRRSVQIDNIESTQNKFTHTPALRVHAALRNSLNAYLTHAHRPTPRQLDRAGPRPSADTTRHTHATHARESPSRAESGGAAPRSTVDTTGPLPSRCACRGDATTTT